MFHVFFISKYCPFVSKLSDVFSECSPFVPNLYCVFQKFITEYFSKRTQLVCGFVLVDIRHEPQKVDLEFMQWLGENQIPFCIIFTKADKLAASQIDKHVNAYRDKLLEDVWEEMPQHFVTSSSKAIGRDEVINYIGQINKDLKNS